MKNNIGHNNPDQLSQIAKNIIHLEDEKKAIGEQIAETYAEAKSAGFDTKTIKKVISEKRKRDKKPEDYDAQKDLFSFYAEKIAPELN